MHSERYESPVCTHDGVLHRVPRAEMRVPRLIRGRMAVDMRQIIADRGVDCVLDAEMIQLGWTRAQLNAHGEAAGRIVRGEIEEDETALDGIDPPAPLFTRGEYAAAGAILTVAAGFVLAGVWSFASNALAAHALGQRIILSMVL